MKNMRARIENAFALRLDFHLPFPKLVEIIWVSLIAGILLQVRSKLQFEGRLADRYCIDHRSIHTLRGKRAVSASHANNLGAIFSC